MTPPAAFQEYKLYSKTHECLGCVSVPCAPRPPLLIQWGNKFFMRPQGAERYILIDCYLVPLQDMYPDPARSSKPGQL